MANIHRIQEYSDNVYSGRQQRAAAPNINILPPIAGIRGGEDPRKETPCDMFVILCCPTLKVLSLIFIITIIDIIFYFATLSFGLKNNPKAGFLAPLNSVLNDFGFKVLYIYIYI